MIDTQTRKQIAQIAVGKGPAQMGFTPDGRLGFVSLSEENQTAVIDAASRKVMRTVSVGTVPVGRGPNGVNVMPCRDSSWASCCWPAT